MYASSSFCNNYPHPTSLRILGYLETSWSAAPRVSLEGCGPQVRFTPTPSSSYHDGGEGPREQARYYEDRKAQNECYRGAVWAGGLIAKGRRDPFLCQVSRVGVVGEVEVSGSAPIRRLDTLGSVGCA